MEMIVIARKRIWSKEELDDIIYRYTDLGESTTAIGKVHGTKGETVSRLLKENGIPITKSSVNRLMLHDFFEIIDTEEKAYWLGYMVADGNVAPDTEGTRSPTIRITSVDIEVVKGIASAVKSGSKISEDRRDKYKNGICYNWGVRSQKMADDLAKYGVIPNKTMYNSSLNIELIPEELIRHYVRGLYDGDGSIFYNAENDLWQSNITSNSEEFLDDLQVVINKSIGRHTTKIITNYNDIYKLPYSERDTVYLFEWMYKDSTTFLTRKKKLAIRASEAYNEKQRLKKNK